MRVYSFANNTAIFDASHEVTGYGSGDDVIEADRTGPAASHIVGANGDMAVSLSSDRSGYVKFKLLQTSSSNRYLWQRYVLQEAGSRLFVPLGLVVMDIHRLDVLTGIAGYFEKLPNYKRGEKANEQEWKIIFQKLWMDFGDPMGLGSPSTIVENLG